MPAAQLTQLPPSRYVPFRHVERQVLAPAEEVEPAGHAEHADAEDMEYKPARQLVQAVDVVAPAKVE